MSAAFAIAVAAVGLLSAMDAVIKGEAVSFSVPQIALLRYVFGSLGILATIAIRRPAPPTLETVLANAWRAVLGVFTALTFYFALGRLPLAETLALALLSPCFTALFGALILGEKLSRPILVALAIGFAGMLVIVAPNLGAGHMSRAALEGAGAVLVSTFAYSLSLVLLRSRATRDHPMNIVAVQNLGCTVILLAMMPLWPAGTFTALGFADLWDFAALGGLGVAGHLLLTKAYGMAPAARMAAADYTALVYAALFGYAFFAETPTWTTLAGGALIIAGSLAATRR